MPFRLPLLSLLAGLLVCGCLLAAKAPTVGRQYDYVTITQLGSTLRISSTPDHYEQTSVKAERGTDGNFSPLLAKVNEYEAQGYELVNNNVAASGLTLSNYALLRRPKK